MIVIVLMLATAGCKEDNYAKPTSKLTGRVIYGDVPVGVRSNGVELELWQPGYALDQKIPVYVNQDGTFSALLSDGDYKLTLLRGNGPWEDDTDTVAVTLRGATSVDVAVTPYYTIDEESFSVSGSSVSATFHLNRITATRAVEKVFLFVSTTTIVDSNNNLFAVELPGSALGDLSSAISLTGILPDALAGRSYVFARIGVKTDGIAELLYSQTEKLSF